MRNWNFYGWKRMQAVVTLALLPLFALFTDHVVFAKSLSGGAASFGCSTLDHSACDEVCKTDMYWYGHCSEWNGVDFQCKCFQYKAPLDAVVCKTYKDYCNQICAKNKVGGYCFPAKSPKDPRGVPQCNCFKALPEFL